MNLNGFFFLSFRSALVQKRLKIERTLLNHVSSILESFAAQFQSGFIGLTQKVFVFIINTLDPRSFCG